LKHSSFKEARENSYDLRRIAMTCKKRYDNLSKNRGNCFKCSETTTEEIKMKEFGKNVVGRLFQQY